MDEIFVLSDKFWNWADKRAPGMAKALREHGVTKALVRRGPLRFSLTFRGVPVDASDDFDRCVDTDDAAKVLDGTPEIAFGVTIPERAKPIVRDTPIGTTCFVDLLLLQLRTESDITRRVPAEVVGRDGYAVTLRVNGVDVTVDVDEMQCWPGTVWIE